LSVVLFFNSICWSQDQGEFDFGIFGGISLSNVSTAEDQQAATTRLGFNAGVYGDYYFSESWSGKIAVSYNQNGWDDGLFIGQSGLRRIETFSLHYVTIAVSPNWHFGGKNKNWYLNLGPYVSVLAGANAGTTQIRDAFNSTDIGLTGGLGYKFSLARKSNTFLFVEFAGQSGLTDIFKENSGDAVRNGRSSLNVGVIF